MSRDLNDKKPSERSLMDDARKLYNQVIGRKKTDPDYQARRKESDVDNNNSVAGNMQKRRNQIDDRVSEIMNPSRQTNPPQYGRSHQSHDEED